MQRSLCRRYGMARSHATFCSCPLSHKTDFTHQPKARVFLKRTFESFWIDNSIPRPYSYCRHPRCKRSLWKPKPRHGALTRRYPLPRSRKKGLDHRPKARVFPSRVLTVSRCLYHALISVSHNEILFRPPKTKMALRRRQVRASRIQRVRLKLVFLAQYVTELVEKISLLCESRRISLKVRFR